MEKHFSDVDNIVYFVDHGTSCVTGDHILMNVPLWSTIDIKKDQNEVLELGTVIPQLMKNRR